MSKPSARKPTVLASGYETSVKRTALAVVLVVLGIAWMAVYYTVARDAALAIEGAKKPSNPIRSWPTSRSGTTRSASA